MHLVDNALGQRIAEVKILQTQVATVAQPECRRTVVVVVGTIGKAGVRGIGILGG